VGQREMKETVKRLVGGRSVVDDEGEDHKREGKVRMERGENVEEGRGREVIGTIWAVCGRDLDGSSLKSAKEAEGREVVEGRVPFAVDQGEGRVRSKSGEQVC
jgi:hypothetical protein